jgi:hypothetical protein
VAVARILGKVAVSSGLLGCLAGLMLHFHIATYPYLAWALAGSLAIYLWTRPGFRSLVIAILFGLAFAFVYAVVKQEPVGGAALAFLGLGSLASVGLAALWCGPAERSTSSQTCLIASMLPLCQVLAGLSLAATSIAHPKTYDLFLYAFDAQLGESPSFLAGRLLARCAAVRQICYLGYVALPLAMAIAFALDRRRRDHRAPSVVRAFAAAAALGFLLYNFYPATGPVYVFGSRFPFSAPPAGLPPFGLVAVESAPRNAMPSLHLAWALLIFWNSRRWAVGWRVLAGALLAVIALATLGLGEHYLVDLFVAVPFALLAQGLAASGASWRNAVRIACVGTGALLVLAWLTYLRLPSPPLQSSGALLWSLLLGSAAASVILESRLHLAVAQAGVTALGAVNAREYTEPLVEAPG